MPSRRAQPPLSVRLPTGNAQPELPPIAALFLIDFDVKAGYTIVWKQAAPGIELEGLVEYKSLPSGLHTVADDLIYFVHDGEHAGLSAFINTPCDEEEARHARMIAVGVLVPLSYGRLGRAWRHAEGLKDIASKLAEDRKNTGLLDAYWEKNKAKEGAEQERPAMESPSVSFSAQAAQPKKATHNRSRSASDGASLLPSGHRLSPYHPAWSLTTLLDTFGPLIFPIHRAALLRKRILISCHAPVREICNFVYNISVLSNIPQTVTELLAPTSSSQRLRPLFTIGVHDIPFLMEDFEASKRRKVGSNDDFADESGSGWIACTTDSILAMKDTLWDMLITMPPPYAPNAKEKVWPTVEYPRGVPLKATQRDLRRFRALKSGLARLTATTPKPMAAESPRSDTSAGFKLTTGAFPAPSLENDEALDKIVEPPSWTALAYSGFMWWASAGEQARSEEHEEAAHDAALLADLGLTPHTPSMSKPPKSRSSASAGMADSIGSVVSRPAVGPDDDEARTELAVIAYFHRLTAQMLTVMGDLVEGSSDRYEDDDDEGDQDADDVPLRSDSESERSAVRVGSDALESMGLDVWDAHDAEFVKELMAKYFDRKPYIEGKGVEVCGVRVC
ncbi:uncharacterized protein ColSpa_08067 [Colletotrichum spaethianum]|uniref:DUF4484 domain-containing protein n=1 Tax=Colletotrichum spaethianum TaxID=700344 RepID=A0AA37P927_9PEZI|nr:uncharacterized protein ColSpa_08067 [Colletotrichum spaethianum]GKT47886.1 uncharacterized protein ColSpa_08067 [Colletotrichum spaethianum]